MEGWWGRFWRSDPEVKAAFENSMSDIIDAVELQSCLVKATRTSFGDLLHRYADDRFYGFGLYTCDDLPGINPSATTEKGFEKRKQALLTGETRTWEGADVNASIYGDCRWSMYEWEHECHLADAFGDVNKMIQEAESRSRTTESSSEFELLKGTVLAAMVLGLRQLDFEGFFSDSKSRGSTTLFCSLPASFDTYWVEYESARLLNSPSAFETFRKQRMEYLLDDSIEGDESRLKFDAIIEQSGLFGTNAHGD
jgi:hypothetical protein